MKPTSAWSWPLTLIITLCFIVLIAFDVMPHWLLVIVVIIAMAVTIKWFLKGPVRR
jgi:hypothetical protein